MLASLVPLLLAVAAVSPRGAVATDHPLASETGASMLRHGGNAIDAAVAAAFALSVVEPQSSGLGGGGFAVLYTARDKKVHVLDFREQAPAKATPEMYLEQGKARQDLANAGALAVAVPAAVRGYADLVARFGRKPLSQVVSQAEILASRGFQVGLPFVRASQSRQECLAADPEAARIFLKKEDGEPVPLEPGDRLVQSDLARTLHAIGEHGANAFYKGAIARKIVSTLQAGGGLVSQGDLASVKSRDRAPLESSYRGYRIVTMGPPSSGGFILLALLNVLEREDPRAGGYRPEHFLHVMIEAEKRLYTLRQKLGDPAFNPGQLEQIQSEITKDFAGTLRSQIGEQATPSQNVLQLPDHTHTASLSVIDEEGNAIALTTTVNDLFGACLVAKGTGVVMNDQMDDFAVAPGVPNAYGLLGGAENAPGPNKIPLSSMSPTLMFDPAGNLVLSVGAAGGPSIPTTVAQIILHLVDDQMPIDRAVAAPRLHHNLFPDQVIVDPDGIEAATQKALEARGHKLRVLGEPNTGAGQGTGTAGLGKASAVWVDVASGWKAAAGDPRFEGAGAVP